MLPIEATGVLGALAGITEIAKGSFGGDGKGPTPTPATPRPTGPGTPAYTTSMPVPRTT